MHMLMTLYNFLYSKSIFIISLLLTFFAPTAISFLVITFFVFLDFISGVYAAWYTRTKITSKQMRDTIGKSLGYYILILLFFTLETIIVQPYLGYEKLWLYSFIVFLIGSIEAKSICENIAKVIGVNFWDKTKEWLAQNKKNS